MNVSIRVSRFPVHRHAHLPPIPFQRILPQGSKPVMQHIPPQSCKHSIGINASRLQVRHQHASPYHYQRSLLQPFPLFHRSRAAHYAHQWHAGQPGANRCLKYKLSLAAPHSYHHIFAVFPNKHTGLTRKSAVGGMQPAPSLKGAIAGCFKVRTQL